MHRVLDPSHARLDERQGTSHGRANVTLAEISSRGRRFTRILALVLLFTAAHANPLRAADDDDDGNEPRRLESNTRMGEIRLFEPDDKSRAFVFLFSDTNGWSPADDDVAHELMDRGAVVVGVSLDTYLAQLRASSDGCHYVISEVEALSKELQRQRGAEVYRSPILAGRGAAGTFAYAALAQSPAATVAGAVSFDPAPSLATRVPLCEGAPARPLVGGGFAYGPKRELAGWLRVAGRENDPALAFLMPRIPKAALVTLDPSAPRTGAFASLVLDERVLADSAAPEDLSDLPLIELKSLKPPRYLAIFLSGDGGWRDIDKQVAEQLAQGDVGVVGLDSLRYFWTHKSPARVAGDLERILWHYRGTWSVERTVLIGYSFGADVLPAAMNHLSREARATIAQISLMAIGTRNPFEVHITEWLGAEEDEPETGDPIAPEVEKIDPALLQCFVGEEDTDSLCRAAAFAKAERVQTSGGHHFDGDYAALAQRIRDGLTRRETQRAPADSSADARADTRAAATPELAPASAPPNAPRSAPPRDTSALAGPTVEVTQGERLLVIAPHPDDETLGAGGLIQRVLAAGGSVHVVWVTAGDGYVEAVEHSTGELHPRAAEFVAYGERRIHEAENAERTLAEGLAPPSQATGETLGFPDGGLRALLRDHWARTRPERSPTTGTEHPPYPEAADRRAKYDGAELVRELCRVLRETRPTRIAFPDPLDKHPDHHATGLFVTLAVDAWRNTPDGTHAPLPRMLAYLVHWPGWPPGWDQPPERQDSRQPLTLPTAFPERGLAHATLPLATEDVERKGRALAQHATQQTAMPELLRSFVRADEPFTVFTERSLENVADSVERALAEFARGK